MGWLPRMRGDRPSSLHNPHLAILGYPMRGDRPPLLNTNLLHMEATPYARGSTCRTRSQPSDLQGYPVCAGIDLYGSSVSSQSWLPRMRGDRPSWRRCLTRQRLPRMRGDRPLCLAPHQRRRGLPRMRGDRPRDITVCNDSRGYPVCAGIDPTASMRSSSSTRLPECAGDRPYDTSATHREAGYPVCAGIDQYGSRIASRKAYPYARGSTEYVRIPSSALSGLPRMRGDRPTANSHGGYLQKRYPVCAGIDLRAG